MSYEKLNPFVILIKITVINIYGLLWSWVCCTLLLFVYKCFHMINRVTLTRGHPRCTSPSMNDSGNSVEFHFLMSEKSGSQSQAASQLPLIPRFPLEDPGLKEKMPLIIQSRDEHHVTQPQKTRSNFWQSHCCSGLIVFPSVARCTLTIWTW